MADEPIPDVPPPPLPAPLTPGVRPGDGVTPEPPTGHDPAVNARASGSVLTGADGVEQGDAWGDGADALEEAFPELCARMDELAEELRNADCDALMFQKLAHSIDAYAIGPDAQGVAITVSATYTRPLPELEQPEAEAPDVDEPPADAEVRLAEEAGVREPAPPDDDEQ